MANNLIPKFKEIEQNEYNFKYSEDIYTFPEINAYPNGIFPGMKIDNNQQYCLIKNFRNYLNFSKIVAPEIRSSVGSLWLITLFFDNREKGFKSPVTLEKKGKLIGYYVYGKIYHADNYLNAFNELIKKFFRKKKHLLKFFQKYIAEAIEYFEFNVSKF